MNEARRDIMPTPPGVRHLMDVGG